MIKSFRIIYDNHFQEMFLSKINVITGASGAGKTTVLRYLLAVLGQCVPATINCGANILFSPAFKSMHSIEMSYNKGKDFRKRYIYKANGKIRSYRYIRDSLRTVVYFYSQNNILSFFNDKSCVFYLDCCGNYKQSLSQYEELMRLYHRYTRSLSSLNEKKQMHSLACLEKDKEDLELVMEIPARYLSVSELIAIKDAYAYGEILINMLRSLLDSMDRQDSVTSISELEKFLSKASHILSNEDISLIEEIISFTKDNRSLTKRIYRFLDNFSDRYSSSLQIKQEHIDNIQRVLQKYDYKGHDISGLYNMVKNLYEETKALQGKRDRYVQSISDIKKSLLKVSCEIYKKRKAHAERFDGIVTHYISIFGIHNTLFCTSIESKVSKDGSFTDRKDFLQQKVVFSLKRNGCIISMDKISGGEMTRILLAVKIAIKDYEVRDEHVLFIFDEIDQGLGGGEIAILADYFRKISSSCQVIFTTHNAHLSSCADKHFLILKKNVNDFLVQDINKEKRILEVARMLTGKDTSTTRLLAREMISSYATKQLV